MKWRGRRTSANIDDRRGRGMRIGGAGGLGILAVVLIGLWFGVDLTPLLTGGGGGYVTPPEASRGLSSSDDPAAEFVGVVLADTEEVWSANFAKMGEAYNAPTLVLFEGMTPSACGSASAATGPFYCPGDRQIYLDLDFFRLLSRQLGAKGDFAAAYVVAHEVAHHVQNLLGILPQVNRARASAGRIESNRLSVQVELQADCFSGAWARRAEARFGSLESGDVEEAMNAASRIGDDALQRQAGQVVVPDSFTHGSSNQRVGWFEKGYANGDPAACDTFGTDRL